MAEPTREVVVILPLERAVFCADCSALSNGIVQCPACGSKALANVACWLERKPQTDPEPEPVFIEGVMIA